ncbi:MAG: M23 family metallopeptidase [Eubacteriaceae bacterium]|nr:M23 family metallopeptidase [Eubacteriaceae bacterium]
MDREQAAGYSQALLNASFPVRGVRACPIAFGEVGVKQRIKGVLNYRKPAFWVIIAALVLCVAVGVTLMTDPADKSGEQKTGPGDDYKVAYIDSEIWDADGFVDKMLNRDMMAISSIESCPVFRIDTIEDLKEFKSMIGSVADTGKGSSELPSFDETVGEYDEEFFAENSLLVAYVHTANESFDVTLEQMNIEENCIYMFMKRTGEGNQSSDDHQYGFIIKEITDSELADIRYYQAQYGNSIVFEYTGTADETATETSSEAESTDNNESVLAKGTFVSPVDGEITKGFGTSFGKMHNGVDFAAEEGTPIAASDGGTVATAGWVEGYGNCVEIDHGNGVMTRYAHCSELLVSKGDSVSQGQTIAEVGSTGISSGPHCHFEIIINGEAVDPMPWLDASDNAIPIIINNEEDPLGALIEVSRDPEARKSFKYIYPEVPEDYHIDEKNEDETNLMVGYLGSQDKAFIYQQTLAKGGHAQLNVPDGCEARREIINGRNAVIMDKGDGIYFIMIEDGTNVFQFEGSCGYDMLYDMAVQVTSAE